MYLGTQLLYLYILDSSKEHLKLRKGDIQKLRWPNLPYFNHLPTYLPDVEFYWDLTYNLLNVNVDIWNTTSIKSCMKEMQRKTADNLIVSKGSKNVFFFFQYVK